MEVLQVMEQFIGCDAHKKFSVFVAVNEKGQAGEAVRVPHDRWVAPCYQSGAPKPTRGIQWPARAIPGAARGRSAGILQSSLKQFNPFLFWHLAGSFYTSSPSVALPLLRTCG